MSKAEKSLAIQKMYVKIRNMVCGTKHEEDIQKEMLADLFSQYQTLVKEVKRG